MSNHEKIRLLQGLKRALGALVHTLDAWIDELKANSLTSAP